MEQQKEIFDVITHIWQQTKPYLAKIPLTDADWEELVDKQGELTNYFSSRYSENAVYLASGIMVGLARYIEKEGKRCDR